MKPKKTHRKWIVTKADERAIEEGCYFDEAAAERALKFFQFVRLSKGDWYNKPIKLFPWQVDIVARLFGWKRPDGTRRFRRASIWTAKKAGKSTFCAVLCLMLLVGDGEGGAQIVSCSNSVKQSGIIFDEVYNIIQRSKDLKGILTTCRTSKTVAYEGKAAKYFVISSDGATAEGWDLSATVIDEIHRMKRPDLFNALYYSGRARRQPLFVTISTAGTYDPESIAWREWCYAKDILKGEILDTEILPVIFAADPEDDPWDEATWHKANPSLGTQADIDAGRATINIEDFRREAERAKNLPSERSNFFRYSLNLWVQSDTQAIDLEQWNKCDGAVNLDDWKGRPIFCGLDLSSVSDTTAFCAVCLVNGIWQVKPIIWIPEDQIANREARDRIRYLDYVRQGHIRTIPESAIDYDIVGEQIAEFLEPFKKQVMCIALDPHHNSQPIANMLEGLGFKVRAHGQGYSHMSPAIRELERLYMNELLAHGGNPVLSYMAANCRAKTDDQDRIRFIKKEAHARIDGIIALVMALGAHLSQPVPKRSVYESRPLRTA